MTSAIRAMAAAASLACAAPCLAQASTVLYGRIDLNLTRTSGQGVEMTQSSTSRLGLRGQEALGGGVVALFQLEAAIDADTGGADGRRFWGRESWVGLRGGLGTLRLGRTQTPSQRVASNYDPHGTDGIGSLGSTGLLIGLSALPRFQNGLYYESPAVGGLSVFAGAQLDEVADAINDRHKSLRLRYVANAIDASLAIADMGNGDKVTSFGLAYRVGAFTPMMQYHAGKRSGAERSTLLVGALARLGPGELRAAWSNSDDKRKPSATPLVTPQDRMLFAVGYDHPLSKRTVLYGTVASDRTERRDAAGGGVSNRAEGVEAGIRHMF